MKGWILYKRNSRELTADDHGVNRLLEAAAAANIVLEVYKPEQFDLLTTANEPKTVHIDQVSHLLPDFLLPRIGAETTYFALSITRHLEQQGVYVCNSPAAIAMVKDKMYMSQQLMGAGLPTPKTMLVKHPVSIEMVERELGFPVVIKTVAGAKGYGIHLCETAVGLKDLMELMSLQQGLYGLILQEFVASSYGCDLRVFVLGERVVGCMKRRSVSGFKANFSLGGEVESFPLTKEIEQLAVASAHLFGLEIAGIDLLFKPQGFTICEANSSPGFKGMEQATGQDIATLIIAYVMDALAQRRSKTPLS